jgi:cytoskeletal protein CcmA (bactofilin family)
VGGKRLGWRHLAWVTAFGLLALIGSSVAFAQSVLGGKFRTADQIVVAQGETVQGDLYASGRTIRVDGTIDGDLVAAGAYVEVTGEVTGDLMVGSGTVQISGDVGGDARVGAGQVTLSGSVGEDLLVGAGQVTVTSSGEVGEDFVFGTGRTTLDGRVAGDVLGSTGTYVRRGVVGGNEKVNIREPEEKEEPTVGDRLLGGLRRLASVLIVGALLLWLAPRFMDGSSETVRRRPLASVGVGALSLIGSVVLAVVVLIVVLLLGILLGLLGLGGLFATLIFGVLLFLLALAFFLTVVFAFVAPAVVGLAVGRLLLRDGSGLRRWAALLIGVLLVVAISSIPVVGGVIGFLIALFGLGAVVLTLWHRRRARSDVRPERPDAMQPIG